MTRPGTVVTLRETPSTVSLPTDTGVAFMAGLTDRGPLLARLIQSLTEFVTVFGDRQSYSPLYDAVDVYFREGGNKVYIGRVVGPSATYGFKNLMDGAGSPLISLVATAIGPGAWSSSYKVAVVAGVGSGTIRIQVTDSANNVLEDSGDLATQTAAVQWSSASAYIRVTIGASLVLPIAAAAAALSAGTDDRGSIVDASWLAAENLFTADLGPGQVMAPGRTSSVGLGQLISHAEANNRVALLDLPDIYTEATLEADAQAVGSRFAASFAPWVIVPGVTSGSTRTVPPSALVAGLIARNDPSLGPNRPAAGLAGISRYATGLSQVPWTDTVRGNLNVNGVNVIRSMFGSIRVYGWRSMTDPVTDANWIPFGNARLFMAISGELEAVGENFVFDEIDGQNGETIGNFHSALAGVLLNHYNKGELFGDTADLAFSVDTGPSVNTLDRIANNELHAVCAMKMSPMAEWIQTEIVKVQVSQTL